MMANDNNGLSFGNWLRDELERRGIIQREFARAVQIDEGAVSRWINDRQTPSTRFCDTIADVLGIEPNEVRRRAGRPLKRTGSAVHLLPTPDRPGYANLPSQTFSTIRLVPIVDVVRGEMEEVGVLPIPAPWLNATSPVIISVADGSMAPSMLQGAIAIADQMAPPVAGDVVAILYDEHLLLREWWPDDVSGDVVLRARSAGAPAVRLTADDLNNDAVFIGPLVAVVHIDHILRDVPNRNGSQ